MSIQSRSQIILLFLLLIPAVDSSLADNGQFTIGYALDLSGKAAFIGVQSRAGAELARRELEKEGTVIKMIYGDHRTDPKTAVSEVTKMLTADHVRAVLSDTTPATTAISPVVKRANKLLLYQSPSEAVLAENPLAFRNFLDYQEGCRRIAVYFKNQGVEKFASLKAVGEFGELCTRGTATVFPQQTVLDYVSGDDLKSAVTRLKSERIEALVQSGYEVDFIGQFTTARDLNFRPKVGMPQPLLTKLVREKAGSHLEGVVVFGFPDVDPSFIERLKQAGLFVSLDSVESATIAYLHVRQLAHVFRRCLIGEYGCEAAELAKQGPDTAMQFKGWKDRQAQYDWGLRIVKGGQFKQLKP